MKIPRYLRYSVTSLVENTEGIFQYNGLFVCWNQFNLQSQFHTSKVRNINELFKHLKKIIALSLIKEGIVAQFLPESKNFWVSMSYVL